MDIEYSGKSEEDKVGSFSDVFVAMENYTARSICEKVIMMGLPHT